MASLTNLKKRPVALPTGHVVPRLDTLAGLDNETILCTDNHPTINGLVLSGAMTVELDAEEEPEEEPPAPGQEDPPQEDPPEEDPGEEDPGEGEIDP